MARPAPAAAPPPVRGAGETGSIPTGSRRATRCSSRSTHHRGWGDFEIGLFQHQRVGQADRAAWTRDEYTFGGLLLKRGDTAIELPTDEEASQAGPALGDSA
jgi:hypothetical protein